MKEIWGFLKFLSGLYLIYLAFYFLYWYIKMHFHPKWFWAFWIYTFFVISIYINDQKKTQEDYNQEYINIMYDSYINYKK
jgi:hypothetical protein